MTERMTHIYTGDGKGKTTAAAGLLLRAVGHGQRCLFCQFLKDGTSGEIGPLKHLGVTVQQAYPSEKFFFEMTSQEQKDCLDHSKLCYNNIKAQMLAEKYDMIVLDEIIPSVSLGIFREEDILDLIRCRPRSVELILTGRGASETLCAAGDYVSVIRAEKHPFERGVTGRAGVEF
jgi:cob(I)alamin adenosyltransferase